MKPLLQARPWLSAPKLTMHHGGIQRLKISHDVELLKMHLADATSIALGRVECRQAGRLEPGTAKFNEVQVLIVLLNIYPVLTSVMIQHGWGASDSAGQMLESEELFVISIPDGEHILSEAAGGSIRSQG